jgi:hypothetical protein
MKWRVIVDRSRLYFKKRTLLAMLSNGPGDINTKLFLKSSCHRKIRIMVYERGDLRFIAPLA